VSGIEPALDRPPERIIVRLPNWTGDVVMCTPVLRALRAWAPAARIVAQVRPPLAALLGGAPWLDSVESIDDWRGGVRGWLKQSRALRGERFELGVCLPDSVSSALSLRLAGVRRVVGHARGLRGALLHESVEPEADWGRHRVVSREHAGLHLLAAIGCPPQGTHLELFTSRQDEERLESALGVQQAAETWLVLAPGASFGSAKHWSAASFARVGDALARVGARVAICGTSAERELGARVRDAMREPALDLCGRLDLGAFKALVRRASLVVCNDAGARHVAVAFRRPALVAFGPTRLEKTDANLAAVSVLSAEVECSPCGHRECPIDHRCMTRIEVEPAIERALQLFEAGAR
jgi:heptosyltransferase-2